MGAILELDEAARGEKRVPHRAVDCLDAERSSASHVLVIQESAQCVLLAGRP